MNDSDQSTLKSVLDRGARNQPHDKNVVTYIEGGCHRMLYKELHTASNRLSSALSAHGVGVEHIFCRHAIISLDAYTVRNICFVWLLLST